MHEEKTKQLDCKLRSRTANSHTASSHASSVFPPQFDVGRNIHLVPLFLEKDVEKYFGLAQRVWDITVAVCSVR